jgi:hypothetical protein
MKYEVITKWDVIPAMADHKDVYVLDREKKAVISAMDLTLGEWTSIYSEDYKTERYEFWVEVKEDEN